VTALTHCINGSSPTDLVGLYILIKRVIWYFHQINYNIDLVIQNTVIEKVDHFKYVGVIIDSNLKRSAHIE